MPSPTSRGSLNFRFSNFDALWALASPLLALFLRDARILSIDGMLDVALYCALAIIFSLISFAMFRIHEGMTRYFSVHDALDVAKAVIVTIFLTYLALFTITRLEGVPRTVPLMHALILGAGLLTARTVARLSESHRAATVHKVKAPKNIIIVGSSRLSSLYMKFLDAYSPHGHRVMAVLDNRPHMIGRSLEGVRIVGTTQHIEPILQEFSQHGIRIDQVLIETGEVELSASELAEIRRVCTNHDIRLHLITALVGLDEVRGSETIEPVDPAQPALKLPFYFFVKRFLDFAIAVTAIVIFLPLWLLVAIVVLLDVGSPILFWQQRQGMGGYTFLVYKFRTLKPPFDWRGEPIPESERLSVVGRFIRKCRLDELPQLLNVLVGDMSLIGPRPLLPADQPSDPSIRLAVRPGITGWAQVSGGTALTPTEKDELDEWYIRNASLWLDVQIVVLTVLFVFTGQRRSEKAILAARALRQQPQAQPASREFPPEHKAKSSTTP